MPPSRRAEAFKLLSTTLVQHEVAEEETVYPAIRKLGDPAGAIADERIGEQAESEELLHAMAKISPNDPEFGTSYSRLRAAVLEHASKEETEVFPLLLAEEDAAELLSMGHRYETARRMAPTRPHPGAPDTPPGNVVLGPVAAAADRVRDAFRSIG